MKHIFRLTLFSLFIIPHLNCLDKTSNDPPNILFIAIDDLRTELGCYGSPVISPHLDRLASQGFLFQNHFVNVPTCGASRFSLLTGMRPMTKAHLGNNIFEKVWDDQLPKDSSESFVHHLRKYGYYTLGIGKISHSADGLLYGYQENPSNKKEMPMSWDEFLFDSGKWKTGWNAFFGYADGSNRNDMEKQVHPYEQADVKDTGYPDGLTTEIAIKKLDSLRDLDQPFFMGVGLFKPHLPFNAPKKYWDLYHHENIPLPPYPELIENVHETSMNSNGEFNQYALGEEKAYLDNPVSEEYAKKLKHAYFACVSYIDAQVGRILDELDKQGLSENTIVIVWGDHGWHLGDQRMWGKHTLFENALKSTLIIKCPNYKTPKRISEVVESVDLYPTLMELTGLDIPSYLDGESLVPIFKGHSHHWNNNAFGYYRNGISLRTPDYRLTQYFREEQPIIELFDHRTDHLETSNMAKENADLIQKLLPEWEKGNNGIFE